jgi:hypothetical protein
MYLLVAKVFWFGFLSLILYKTTGNAGTTILGLLMFYSIFLCLYILRHMANRYS